MKLKTRFLRMEAGGKPIVVLNKSDAEDIGIKSSDRVNLRVGRRELVAIVNVTTKIINRGWIGVYEEVRRGLNLKERKEIEVEIAKFPRSLNFIRNKLKGRKLNYDEIYEIVKDVIEGKLNDIEISSFVTSLHDKGLDLDEATNLSIAMVETGEKLKLNKKIVVDKHCLPEDVPTIVRNDGNVKIENIGTIIDGIFDKCDPNEIIHNDDSEFTEKNIENLYVLAHDDDGKVDFRPVSGVFRVKSPKYLKEIILIGNRKIRTTLDHTIFVLKEGKIINLPAKDVKEGDFVVVPTGLKQRRKLKEISIKKGLSENIRSYRKLREKIKINPEFMRLLGYYVSEGFINHQGIFFNFGSHEKELIEDCIACIKKVFGIIPTINKPHKTAVRVCIYSRILSKVFEKDIKAGSSALKKRLPSFIFDVSDEMKLEFLKALFKGDGYVRRGYEAVYVTSSKKLATDLQYLLSILGISVSMSVKKASKRKFPIGENVTHESMTSESYYIYTQAREIFGNREKANIAYINLLPIKELGKINTEKIGWEFRRRLKRQKYMTKEKLLRIIDKIESEDVKKIIRGHISVLQVKKVRKVPSKSKYIYDFKVDGCQRFVAGSAPICIHNSIGGVPGHKTTMILVPIIAAFGIPIPKTSSRAITSASGTADTAEVLMPVSLDVGEMKEVVEKTNGCIVWGGSLHLAPADDIFVRIEYPLSIDPLMIPSIMAKKKAVGATHLVIDVPCGRGTKVKTIGDADLLAKDFIEVGRRLGIKTRCAVTYGEQPIGHTIGSALEAKESLEVLMRRKVIPDLEDKVTQIASMLLEMIGRTNSKKIVRHILNSGKAERKMREIIDAQGGDGKVKPEDIPIGKYKLDVTANRDGVVLWMDNGGLVEVARAAGSPKDKGAGIQLYKKLGDPVKKGEKIFTVYSEKAVKLARVEKTLKEETVVGVGKRVEMLIHKIKEIPIAKKRFILER